MVQSVQVDLSAVHYLDSAALGVLLRCRSRLRAAGKSLELAGVHGKVQEILSIANFTRFFSVANVV